MDSGTAWSPFPGDVTLLLERWQRPEGRGVRRELRAGGVRRGLSRGPREMGRPAGPWAWNTGWD